MSPNKAEAVSSHNARTATKSMLQPSVTTSQDVHSAQSGGGVGHLSRRNPLPALAVYVDVSFSAVLLMLQIALRAAFEDFAAAFRGDHRRFSVAKRLHSRLERLWLSPSQPLLGGTKDSPLDEFGVHLQNASGGQNSAPSCIRASLTGEDGADKYIFQREMKTDLQHTEASQPVETQNICPDSCRLLLVKGNEKVVSPPIELLAAYAGSSSKFYPYFAQSGVTAMMTANPVAGSPRIPFDKPGCVVGLCVRSLLDLFIQAVRSLHPALLPEGSVVLVAAVNIPMMFRILEEHKLLVQPVDVHPSSLMPTNESLQQAMTCWGPRIKGLLCSHLYGGISDMEPVVKFCTKYKILLLEDCAESFVGELYRGSPRADVSFFSFGLIKTCTAAGGGIATVGFSAHMHLELLNTLLRTAHVPSASVRSRIVAARMQSIQSLYPFSSRRTFLKKLCVTLGACFLQSPFVMKSLLILCNLPGWDPGAFLQPFVRGFPVQGELFKLLRLQPNASLLAVLLKRLETWDFSEFVAQQSRAFSLSRRIQNLGLQIPGNAAAFKTFWLFPVLSPPSCNAAKFALALRNNGLYAARDASTLVCCSASLSGAEKVTRPVLAADMMSRIVYLPVNRRATHQQLLQVEAAVAKTVAIFHSNEDPLGTFGPRRSAA